MGSVMKNVEENGFPKDLITIANMKNPTDSQKLLSQDLRKNGDDVDIIVDRVEYSFDELLGAAPNRRGPYKLCWGYTGPQEVFHHELSEYYAPDVTPYPIHVGDLLISGPVFREYECIAGMKCDITVEGLGLSKIRNRLYITGGEGNSASCEPVQAYLHQRLQLENPSFGPIPEIISFDADGNVVVEPYINATYSLRKLLVNKTMEAYNMSDML